MPRRLLAGSRSRDDPNRGRGQSSIDYVIGFAVFVLTFSFVVTLVPDLLSPYTAQATPVVADRAVDTLAGANGLLAAGPVGTLNRSCTEEFFDETNSSACSTLQGGTTPTARLLGVTDFYDVNVTLERNVTGGPETEVVCWDRSAGVLDPDCSASSPLALKRGPSPPGDTRSVSVARRLVSLDDRALFLKLRVW